MTTNGNTGEFILNSNTNTEEQNSPTIPTETDNIKDEFVIGSGSNIQEVELPPEPKKKKRRNSKGVWRGLLWILCILIVSISCVVLGLTAIADYMGLLGDTNTATVTIEKGESLDSVAEELKTAGAIKLKWFFKYYAGSKNYYEQFTEGVHTFSTESG